MKRVVVLVSGGGTNLQAIIDEQNKGNIVGGEVTCVISSNPEAYALERAKNNGIKTRVLPRKDFSNAKTYSQALLEILNEEQADLIVLAGFMTILDEVVTNAYPYKIVNVHPALIPSFCG
jgi:phosphoribosylglycinamide formyltransferase-1